MRLRGRVALITGGTSGIGLATSRRFLAEGASAIVVGREADKLAKTVDSLGPGAHGIAADVSDRDAIARLMASVKASHGRLDVLIVSAGVSHAPPIQDLDLVAYERLMAINCRGLVFTVVDALPLMSDGASVVLVGSVAGRKGQPGDALYAGSKGFVRAFARNLGTDPELLRRKIRVNIVTPGPIDTALTQEAVADTAVSAYVEGLIPMHRWGRAEEVATACLFLASNESSFTTGAEITVDGGMAHA